MKFVTATAKEASTPTLMGWVTTINAVKMLWETLFREVPGTTYLELRRINQDPLENLFGGIRSKCGAHCNPSALQFVSALKTCFLNGLVDGDIQGNCEAEDQPAVLLNNLQQFLSGDVPTDATQDGLADSPQDSFIPPNTVIVRNDEFGIKQLSVAYVSGFAVKGYFSKSECLRCEAGLTAASHDEYASLNSIRIREFFTEKQSSTYLSREVTAMFDHGLKLARSILEEDAYSPNVLARITDGLLKDLDFAWWENHYPQHGQRELDGMNEPLCRIYIPWWCKIRNQTMKAARSVARRCKLRILQHQ